MSCQTVTTGCMAARGEVTGAGLALLMTWHTGHPAGGWQRQVLAWDAATGVASPPAVDCPHPSARVRNRICYCCVRPVAS